MIEGEAVERRLRRFGLVIGAACLVLATLSWYRGHFTVPLVLGGVAGAAITLALIAPGYLTRAERAWLRLADTLAWLNTRLILSLLFYLVCAPVGIVRRLAKDPLDRRLHDGRQTYWIPKEHRPVSRETYKQQF